MRQAIEQRQGQAFIAEDLGPVSELEIGGDDQGHALVEGGTELEKELSAGGRKKG